MSAGEVAGVVIEPNLAAGSGHWIPHLVALSRTTARRRQKMVLLCEESPPIEIVQELQTCGTEVVPRSGRGRLRPLFVLANVMRHAAQAHRRVAPRNRFAYQTLNLSRALLEADNLRRAAAVEPRSFVVMPTAGECLAGFSAWLGRTAHIRVIHEVYAWNSPLFRALEWICRRGLRYMVVVCPTDSVRRRFVRRSPGATTVVRSFGLAVDADLATATYAAVEGRGERPLTVAVIGQWHRSKDVGTMVEGIVTAGRAARIRFVVAGSHLPGWEALTLAGEAVTVTERALTQAELVAVYRDCDALLVCRRPGTATESGLVLDAARFGLHLILSDHDPDLSRHLRDEDWVSIYRAGDPTALAQLLKDVAGRERPRPAPSAQAKLGMHTADETLDFYDHTWRHLPHAAGAMPGSVTT